MNGDNVVELGPHCYMTVEEALAFANRNFLDCDPVLIIGIANDSERTIRAVSSEMTNSQAMYYLEKMKRLIN